MNLNQVHLIGRLVRDPELRALPTGTSVCAFSLATNSAFVTKEGKKEETSEFHPIVVFGKTADIAAQYLKKGRLLFVEGRLQTRTWEDAQGVKHWKTEIVADRIQFGPKAGAKADAAEAVVATPHGERVATAV
jgi:single-strand DNA-binding protein